MDNMNERDRKKEGEEERIVEETLTIRGFSLQGEEVEVIEYKGKYYPFYPSPANTKIRIKIVDTASTLEDLYTLLLTRILNDNPDPFAIVLKALEDPVFLKILKNAHIPEEVIKLPRRWFEYAEKRLREQEKKKPVVIEISILKGLVKAVRYLKEKGKTEEEIEHIMLSLLESQEDEHAYYYWNGHDLYRAVKLVIEEEERRKEREEEKERREEEVPIPIPTSSTSTRAADSIFVPIGNYVGSDISSEVTSNNVVIQLSGAIEQIKIVLAELQRIAMEHGVKVQIIGGNYVEH